MLQLKSILVPIDFSTSSYNLFELAYRLAKLHGANLHIIHVIDSLLYDENHPKISDIKFIYKLRKKNAEEELKKFKFEVPHSDIEITEALIEGVPHKEILSYVRKNDIDMIVIGSHGWTNLPHVTMGGIADKIMLQANVPVVCVKSNFIGH
jgi:nucleotide-binding universal stress UspA family protein